MFVYVSRKKKNFQTLQIPTSGLWCLEEYGPIIYTNTHQKFSRVFLTLAVIELLVAETKLRLRSRESSMTEYVTLTNVKKQIVQLSEKGKVHPCTGTEALYRPYGL